MLSNRPQSIKLFFSQNADARAGRPERRETMEEQRSSSANNTSGDAPPPKRRSTRISCRPTGRFTAWAGRNGRRRTGASISSRFLRRGVRESRVYHPAARRVRKKQSGRVSVATGRPKLCNGRRARTRTILQLLCRWLGSSTLIPPRKFSGRLIKQRREMASDDGRLLRVWSVVRARPARPAWLRMDRRRVAR